MFSITTKSIYYVAILTKPVSEKWQIEGTCNKQHMPYLKNISISSCQVGACFGHNGLWQNCGSIIDIEGTGSRTHQVRVCRVKQLIHLTTYVYYEN